MDINRLIIKCVSVLAEIDKLRLFDVYIRCGMLPQMDTKLHSSLIWEKHTTSLIEKIYFKSWESRLFGQSQGLRILNSFLNRIWIYYFQEILKRFLSNSGVPQDSFIWSILFSTFLDHLLRLHLLDIKGTWHWYWCFCLCWRIGYILSLEQTIQTTVFIIWKKNLLWY